VLKILHVSDVSRPSLGSIKPPSQDYRGHFSLEQSGQGLNLTTRFILVTRFRVRGVIRQNLPYAS
jgi:hypothetical protein